MRRHGETRRRPTPPPRGGHSRVAESRVRFRPRGTCRRGVVGGDVRGVEFAPVAQRYALAAGQLSPRLGDEQPRSLGATSTAASAAASNRARASDSSTSASSKRRLRAAPRDAASPRRRRRTRRLRRRRSGRDARRVGSARARGACPPPTRRGLERARGPRRSSSPRTGLHRQTRPSSGDHEGVPRTRRPKNDERASFRH